jgi:hypothetical protein
MPSIMSAEVERANSVRRSQRTRAPKAYADLDSSGKFCRNRRVIYTPNKMMKRNLKENARVIGGERKMERLVKLSFLMIKPWRIHYSVSCPADSNEIFLTQMR